MKFGISSTLFEEEKLSERHFSLIKKAGFEFIEILAGEPHFNPEDKTEAFGKRIIHTHLHDYHGDEYDEHLLLFSGTINWRKALESLQGKGYSGVLLYELSKKKEFVSAKRMKASLLKMRPLGKRKLRVEMIRSKKGSL